MLLFEFQKIPPGFLLYGPVFTPPQGYYVTVPPPEDMEIPERLNKAAENFFKSTTAKKARIIQQQKLCVADDPELYLLMDVLVQCPVYFNILDHMFPVLNCPHKEDHEKKGFNGSDCRTIYGLQANMRVIGRFYLCAKHLTYTTTSSDKFMQYFKPWELGTFFILGTSF
ncbi:hypothetical protein M422DRAFT_245970 [Sphaerobolus stellatus SS14]|nr:hypothetical protein M422DRAFT_245970 [Sphaerobolus stellatus SS14]